LLTIQEGDLSGDDVEAAFGPEFVSARGERCEDAGDVSGDMFFLP
jgi:hypothetical protein